MAYKIINIKFKKVSPTAHTPFHGSKAVAGYDLYADGDPVQDKHGNLVYRTGIAVQIPKGYAGYLFPRSSNARTELFLTNSVGLIDSDYTGEILLKFKTSIRIATIWSLIRFAFYKIIHKKPNFSCGIINSYDENFYRDGERIGQLVILPTPKVHYEEVDELEQTERGNGGYGSSGK